MLGVVLGLALVGLAATEPGIYRDEGHGFQLAYPAGAVVQWSGVPLRIDLPVFPGTTLREKFLWVEVNRTPPAPGAEEVVVQGRAFHLEAGAGGRRARFTSTGATTPPFRTGSGWCSPACSTRSIPPCWIPRHRSSTASGSWTLSWPSWLA